jgi:hypothetical protein
MVWLKRKKWLGKGCRVAGAGQLVFNEKQLI